MRTKNSIKNVFVSFIATFLSIAVGFIAQKIFIKIFGLDYLGVNGLFNNIISMLSISELGIGTAIIYHLYKPIVEDDKQEIKTLMNFYKKSYLIISGIIFMVGLLIIPFIPVLVGPTSITDNLYIIYLLFLMDTVFSYLLSYKRSILYANQKNYYIHLIHIGYIVLLNLLQIIILYTTKNYYLYLFIKFVMRVIENGVITILANKLYPFLKEKDSAKLSEDTKHDIYKKVKALIFHQLGSFFVLGTDNILISLFFGVTIVGLYSNYNMITNAINSVLSQIFKSVTASIGNLIITSDHNHTFKTYEKIHFFNFWIASFTSICLLCIMDSFIRIWLGPKYILSFEVLLSIVVSFYFMTMKKNISVFKEAAGIVYKDRFIPLIESAVNIITSIIFLKLFGLMGVFIGTILSSFVLHLYSYPKYVYMPLFRKSYREYMINWIKDFAIFTGLATITYIGIYATPIDNNFLEFAKNVVISFVVPNILFYLLFYKNENLKFYCNLLRRKKNAS